MRGRPPILPIQYTELSETSAPANPLSMTSGSAACPLLAKNPPANRTMSPEEGRPKLSSAAPRKMTR